MGICVPYVDNPIGRLQVVTAATRPTGANRYLGARIYETDTQRMLRWDGVGWIIMAEPIQTWTPIPTPTNVTVGNGAFAGTYHRSDGWCDFEMSFTLGSTSAFTGQPAFPMPFTVGLWGYLNVELRDAAVNTYVGYGTLSDPIALGVVNVAGTYAAITVLSSTVPFTWANGDSVHIAGRFKMANPYS